jgi:uncharacterized membrane protein (UPF0127 family)
MAKDYSQHTFKSWHAAVLGSIALVFICLRWIFPPVAPVTTELVPGVATVTVGSSTFPALIANTAPLAYQGLSGRESLGNYGGMLFVFPSVATRTFVMREMRFPLDIVWIKNGEIVGFSNHLPLEPGATNETLTPYSSTDQVDMVLEVASGTVDRSQWRRGDSVRITY